MINNKLSILALILGFAFYPKILPKEWENLKFETVSLKPAPKWDGPLASNKILEEAEILFKDELDAPESIIIEGDTIYASTVNEVVKIVKGKIVKRVYVSTTPDCFKHPHPSCGRPLGIRRLNKDLFIIADGVKGLVTLNFEKEEFKTLVYPGKKYDGRWISFADDVDVIDEDNVVFTDASWLYDQANLAPSFYATLATGRVYKYNIKSDEMTLLMDEMYFANGIQLMPDKQSLLVSETLTARIHRYYFAGSKKGQHEVFMDGLPGHPDNIRLSSDGKTLWIAFAIARIPGEFSMFEKLFKYPNVRKFIHNYLQKPLTWLMESFSDAKQGYGLAIQTDLNGKILRSFHSPNSTVNNLSQLTDDGKYLYFCSYLNPFMARIKL